MPARSPFGLSGVATTDLTMGLGDASSGNALRDQVGAETEEERRRRLLGLSVTQQTGSLAAQSLFGPPQGALNTMAAGVRGALGRLGGRR